MEEDHNLYFKNEYYWELLKTAIALNVECTVTKDNKRGEEMSKKMIGGICAIIAILAGGSMVIIGTLTGSWENLWLIPFCGGILIAAFSIIAGIANEKNGKK